MLVGTVPCLDECCFTATETVGLSGTGAQDGHLDFHTAPELCLVCKTLVFLSVSVERHLLVFSICVRAQGLWRG